eukprot:Partr_v1_DN27617_c2_g1_i2_m65032
MPLTTFRFMVTSGGLSRVQQIAAAINKETSDPSIPVNVEGKEVYNRSKMAESILKINACFPEEIVRYYSPGYSTTLLSKIDDFTAEKGTIPTKSAQASQVLNDTKSKKFVSSMKISEESEQQNANQLASQQISHTAQV